MDDNAPPQSQVDPLQLIDTLDSCLASMTEQGRPLDALHAIRQAGDVLSQRSKEAANAAAEGAWSWADVGEALGVSKQAAHQRFSDRKAQAKARALSRIAEAERSSHERVRRSMERARAKVHRKLNDDPDSD